MKIYDIVIIGSGPGGYVSAIKSSQLGFKTALVEKYDRLGGTCLNVGCIPSKTLLDSSEKFYNAKKNFADHGILIKNLSLNFETLIQRKNKIIKKLSDGIKFLVKKNKIDIFYGNASFIDSNNINVYSLINQENNNLKFKNAIIATGSKPNNMSIFKIDNERIISSNDALSLNEIPKKLIILGGGVVGLELGLVYSRLGSNVEIIEKSCRIVPFMDYDISRELEKILIEKGIKFHLSTEVISIDRHINNVNIKIKNKYNYSNIIGDYCLISIGRIPFTNGLNLEKVGIKVDKKGFIKVDNNLRTDSKNIYAIGDVIGGLMLAHKASDEGIYVVETISGQKPFINYKNIPLVIYTNPEVATVGYTEYELVEKNINYKIGKFPIKFLGRAESTGNNKGFTKLLTNYETDQILGVHIISPRASDIIMEAVISMEFYATSEDLYRISHPHPTFTESLKEASMLALYGKSIHL